MRISGLPLVMGWCLLLTVAVETLFAAILKTRRPRDFLLVVLANVMTNPVLVSVTYLIRVTQGMKAYFIALALFEVAAAFAEALVYRSAMKNKFNPFLFSLILNAASFSIGWVINRFVF